MKIFTDKTQHQAFVAPIKADLVARFKETKIEGSEIGQRFHTICITPKDLYTGLFEQCTPAIVSQSSLLDKITTALEMFAEHTDQPIDAFAVYFAYKAIKAQSYMSDSNRVKMLDAIKQKYPNWNQTASASASAAAGSAAAAAAGADTLSARIDAVFKPVEDALAAKRQAQEKQHAAERQQLAAQIAQSEAGLAQSRTAFANQMARMNLESVQSQAVHEAEMARRKAEIEAKRKR